MTQKGLSKEDIDHLLLDQSPRAQLTVVEKLTDHYAAEGADALTAEETAIANDIFRLLLSRSEVTVRALLAMNLSQLDKLPHDIARTMAQDVNEVSIPILQYSDVLNDEDLRGIIHSLADVHKLNAIAKRSTVSEMVSGLLVDTHMESVVATLIKNDGATITDKSFDAISRYHGENAEVMESIFQRSSAPAAVIEKIISRLSDKMRQNLEQKYGSLTDMKEARKVLDQSLELANLKMLSFNSADQELMRLIKQLDVLGKLSPFSALSVGNVQLFEISLARLLRVPLKNVHVLLQDPVGFKAVYEHSGLPVNLFPAVSLALDAIRSLDQDKMKSTTRKQDKNARIIERMQQLAGNKTIDGIDRLYAMLQHCAR